MKTINFSSNWNNKLDCRSFTTLRPSNTEKYKIGESYNINLKANKSCAAPKKYGIGTIVSIRRIFLNQIDEYIAFIDTGYNKETAISTIKKIYPGTDWSTQKLDFLLIKKQP